MGRRRRVYNYKFADKSHSPKGIMALAVSLCTIGAGVGLVLYSFFQEGANGLYLALGGFASLIVAAVGFGLAVSSLREEGRRRLFPVLALIISILALGGWIGIYVLGFLYP